MVKGEDIRIPMLFTGGWFDIYTDGVIAAFEAVRARGSEPARKHSRLIMGPWIHGIDQLKNGQLEFPAARYFGMKKARAFVDYWVRDVPNSFDKAEAPITYFQMGVNEWRTTAVWPPKDSREQAYYFGGDKTLATRLPAGKAAPLVFKFDPANPAPTVGGQVLTPELRPGPADQREKVESRDDVLVFSTPVLEKDVAITGKVKVKLFVSSDRVDTDFTAILTDVYPDGRSLSVTEGIRRMRFRNTTAKEELLKPGEVYPVTIELTNTALTFLKGHRVRVLVSSSNYPKYALNHNDGGPLYRKGVSLIATNTVYTSKQHPSALILPVVSR
jgi:putative CocE/NonD family hydrolase